MDTNRPALQECLAYLRDGRTLHVHSMDRLARNLDDLHSMVKELTGRGVVVRFQRMGCPLSAMILPWLRCCSQCWGGLCLRYESELARCAARKVPDGMRRRLSGAHTCQHAAAAHFFDNHAARSAGDHLPQLFGVARCISAGRSALLRVSSVIHCHANLH